MWASSHISCSLADKIKLDKDYVCICLWIVNRFIKFLLISFKQEFEAQRVKLVQYFTKKKKAEIKENELVYQNSFFLSSSVHYLIIW